MDTYTDMLPPDFTLLPRRIEAEFTAIREAVNWSQETIRLFGHTTPIPRLTAMYGSAYTYSGIFHPANTLPPLLEEVRQQVAVMTGIHELNSVLCNLYRTGLDGVSWHSDDDYRFIRPEIASVSFGSTRRFSIRNKADRTVKFNVDLAHGMVLLMSGRSQIDWQHSIPKTTARGVGPRINLTFRCIES